jgi:hypothetical protein
VQDDIVAVMGGEAPPDHYFADGGGAEQMRAEMAQLHEALAASERSVYWNGSEAAWNLLVHWPMLKIAVSSLDHVSAELVTAPSLRLLDRLQERCQMANLWGQQREAARQWTAGAEVFVCVCGLSLYNHKGLTVKPRKDFICQRVTLIS